MKTRLLSSSLVACATLSTAILPAHAASFTLSSGNSEESFTVSSSADYTPVPEAKSIVSILSVMVILSVNKLNII